MVDIDERERFYFGRTQRPHCATCVCPAETKLKSKVTVTTRTPRLQRLPYVVEKKCVCGCPHSTDIDLDGSNEIYSLLHKPISSPTRVERRVISDGKYGLLEGWFKRFDLDNNGLIDTHELRTMLNYLGVSVEERYCERLLDKADRDGDGRLTFPEFLLLWRLAQYEDELVEIVREYDLFPDVVKVRSSIRMPTTQITKTVKRDYGRHETRCHCGHSTKTYTRSPHRETVEYTTRVSQRSTEKLPILSCYR